MSDNIYSIYWIHTSDQNNPKKEGYIGISRNVDRRFKDHKKSNFPVGHAIRKHQNDIKIDLLYEQLDEETAKNIEYSFRPEREIGWNLEPGGGLPPSHLGRKKLERSEQMKGDKNPFYGKNHTQETKDFLSDMKKGKNHPFYGKKRPDHSKKMKEYRGANHFNFKGYFITPAGKFDSYLEASKANNISIGSIYNYCINKNDSIINRNVVMKCAIFSESDVGKTYREAGFGYEPKK